MLAVCLSEQVDLFFGQSAKVSYLIKLFDREIIRFIKQSAQFGHLYVQVTSYNSFRDVCKNVYQGMYYSILIQ
jgi:hypothetical protein